MRRRHAAHSCLQQDRSRWRRPGPSRTRSGLAGAIPGLCRDERPEDVASLRLKIIAFSQRGVVETELFLPWSAQQLRKDIYASCVVVSERAEAEGAFFLVRGEPATLDRLREQFAQLNSPG